ncbi:MAG: glucuronate isomerase [Erysipelotrichaceae bacterium]|jgi:glucuronate isomerase
MKEFMDNYFLLDNQIGRYLYHNYASKMPIIDYHCHISAQEIYEDRKFENITQVWLGGDHYKWRQMRTNGIEEKYITGDSSDYEKFVKWIETLQIAIGNPLYHWSHLELQRYFDYHSHVRVEDVDEIWNSCNEKLKETSARKLIEQSNVEILATTDDPIDDLKYHQLIKEDKSFKVKVLPAFRPEKAMNIEKDYYLSYLDKLTKVSGVKVNSFTSLVEALINRMYYFKENGCCISDHSLDYVYYSEASLEEVEKIFQKRLNNTALTKEEITKFKTLFMLEVGKQYHKLNWVSQLHYGVVRNVSQKLFKSIGPDVGVDAIDNYTPSVKLGQYLNALEEKGYLGKTIVYSLNPIDNAAIDSIIGCFQDASAKGKIQHGSAWWFNDHKQGMEEHLISLANLSLLSNFIGMLTDSRSFLSYTRHEYFRRILCNLIGNWVESGQYPNDERLLKDIIEGICYKNAIEYFGFN